MSVTSNLPGDGLMLASSASEPGACKALGDFAHDAEGEPSKAFDEASRFGRTRIAGVKKPSAVLGLF